VKLILATDNKNKIREFRELLRDEGVEVLSRSEAGLFSEVEETGETFAENAFIKAAAAARDTGLPAVADDSGLAVDALGGAPGVKSARYTGNHADSDRDRYELLLKNMRGAENRRARFVCSMCCVFPNGDVLRSVGTCEGRIAFAPAGNNGFGYDPVFLPDEAEGSMAQLTMEEKNRISHRGKALRAFLTEWRNYHADRKTESTAEKARG
jgi:XTP/dITP diphosphohydrolase